MEVGDELQGTVDVSARLHVHADEILELSGAADQLFDIGEALVVGKIQTELRQLERNVAANVGFQDRAKSAEVDVARGGGFVKGGDALAEVIERHGKTFGIEFAADRQDLVQGLTGDEPGGESFGGGGRFEPFPQQFPAREPEKEDAHVV